MQLYQFQCTHLIHGWMNRTLCSRRPVNPATLGFNPSARMRNYFAIKPKGVKGHPSGCQARRHEFFDNGETVCALHPADFVAIAQGAGIDVFQIDDPSTCGSQLDGVADHPGPILIEAVVDQFTPPMPAKIKAT